MEKFGEWTNVYHLYDKEFSVFQENNQESHHSNADQNTTYLNKNARSP